MWSFYEHYAHCGLESNRARVMRVQAVVGEGAIVEDHAILEPGSVVHSGFRVPKGQVFGGNPASESRRKVLENNGADDVC
jgi:carbonic anhydrase/acetyltransferase-like protein (isoleucine patch superfamily)